MAIKEYTKSEEEKQQLGKTEAGRFDAGKVRHDLIPGWAIEKLAEVYTYGAQKYDDNNWLKGMKWSKIMGPLERHYNKWKRGSIKDKESNCYHLAMVAWNAIALLIYQENGLGVDNRCPVSLDRIPQDARKAIIEHWLKCAVNEEEYNGLVFKELIEKCDEEVCNEGDCASNCQDHETCCKEK